MNGPWCVRVLPVTCKFYANLCSSSVNASSSCRRITFWLMFCISLYPTLNKFLLTYLSDISIHMTIPNHILISYHFTSMSRHIVSTPHTSHPCHIHVCHITHVSRHITLILHHIHIICDVYGTSRTFPNSQLSSPSKWQTQNLNY